jgi:2-polyprenyl-3-methyl-5-hydroxy-6-metoxy-1,4-benzoquinol methylase
MSVFANHNLGWRSGNFDVRKYLLDSEIRYSKAYEVFSKGNADRILDVGGFLGAFPLTLHKLGHQVTIAEKFSYYGNALDRVKNLLSANGVGVIDVDFTGSNSEIEGFASTFDGVSCMAVAEHLAHSPKILMDNISRVLVKHGALVFEIPNLAFWPRRYSFFFRGESVMAPIEDVYHSSIPFTGHHREYTLEDARYVVAESGFTIVKEETYNYSIDMRNLWHLVKFAPAMLFKEWAEVIFIHAKKNG